MPPPGNSITWQSSSARMWVAVWAVALGSRLLGAFLLPNAEQDGYSYAEEIAAHSANLAAAHYRVTDLFGFWLPLFQFVSALLNLGIGNPLLAGKIVSALCGAASCVLVFAITQKLTRSVGFALLAFAAVLFNPLHIVYSAAAMTDVPFGCLVLASLWCLLQDKWLGAAIFAALAEGVRLEGWIFLVLLPLLQFVRQKRISLSVVAIVLFPIAGWLLISYAAASDPFAYFAKRARYQASYVDSHPTRHGFAFTDIRNDLAYFLSGANTLVFFASVVSLVWLISRGFRRADDSWWKPAATAAYIFSLFGIILFAYVTKRQPVILPRYALFFLVLGLPLLAWLLQLVVANIKPASLATLGTLLTAAVLFVEIVPGLPIFSKVLNDFRAQQHVAQTLISELGSADAAARCFSDDAAVRVLSRLPRERFIRSETTPAAAREGAGAFESYLRDRAVRYLVFFATEDSLPVKLYPQLCENPPSDTGKYEFVTMAHSTFGPDIWLYRLH